ncbi:MAG: PQQ-binding-like beta-propeller repeat protein [Planctomycetia bacterium]
MDVMSSSRAGLLWLRVVGALAAVGAASFGATGRADCLCGTAADGLAAERAGLDLEWLVQIPFNAATSTLEHVVIDRDLVVVQTGDGNVVAVQAGGPREGKPLPGTILWKHPIDAHAGPFQPAAIGPDLVAVAHGDGIHAFDRATGQSRWSSRFPNLADGGAAISDGWVYTPFGDGKIMRLPTNPYRKPEADATPAADAKKEQPAAKKPAGKKKGRTAPQQVESLEPLVLEAGGIASLQPHPFQDGVLWCTDDGTLVVLDPSGDGWRRNEFFLDRLPAGRPLVHGGAIFAATVEGDLMRIDSLEEAAAGALRLAWRVFLDARPEGPLFASGERLIVPLGDEGLAVYSTKTGDLEGRTHVCGRVMAVAAGRIWLVDRVGRLVSLDLETGELRDRFCLGGFTFPVVNQATDRLILASPSGAIVSLKAHDAK